MNRASNNTKITWLAIIIWILFPVFTEAENKLVSISVDSGTVTRDTSFIPTMRIFYSEGSPKTVKGPGGSLSSMMPDILVFHAPMIGAPSSFARKPLVADAVVGCVWTYTEGDITVSTSSTVTVKGQVQNIQVSSGAVSRNSFFIPTMTVYYTDGSAQTFNGPGAALVSTAPDILVYHSPLIGLPAMFAPKYGVPNAIVKCNWTFFDGATATTTSRVVVTGGADGNLVDNEGNSTTKETGYNNSSKNKQKNEY